MGLKFVADANDQELPLIPFRIQEETPQESPPLNEKYLLDSSRGILDPMTSQPGPSGLQSSSNNNLEVPETVPHNRCKPICDSDPPLESLKDEAELFLKWSMASNSWKTYKTAVECFKKCRIIYNYFDIWPVPIDKIAQFIAYLSYKGLSSSTVST
ncbi:unnamed protein product [Mytilus coruscus]|uniref:Uncharacterized protein n=1 Tax=Mytilus coruscus TaxID=42192 RepID=A0A6J8AEU4_MYTCO|nr:unnamed protein product [Mytilus coruscus]